MFNLGDLRGKFIFDRNLGARNSAFSSDGKGTLFYPYGRCAPFVGGTVNGSLATTAYLGRTSSFWTISSESTVTGVSMSYLINRPLLFIANESANWCSEVNSERYIWHDYNYDIDEHAKSIFDPSPYGWKVPADGTWASFSLDATTWNDGDDDGQYGRWYPAHDPIAYYPAHGCRATASGQFWNSRTTIYYWTSTPSSTIQSCRMYSTSNYFSSTSPQGRSQGGAIRPVQHPESAFGN